MANEKMTALWGKLTESGLKNKSLSEFEADMNDYNNRYTLWQNLSKHTKYNKTFDEFTSDMGIMSNEQTEQTETPAPLIQEEPQQKSSNATYWQSIGAHNTYPTIQKPDKEIKMSEVVRPKDYTGQSNDGSIESLLSSSFYNLSDEELSSQMKQLQKELDAPMEPVYGAFKAQTGREYDRSGKNNSHGDDVRLDNILNSMKAAELAKRGYYDANSSMRRAKIKKEVDDLFDDNSGNGKEIKERLSRLSAEKAWRERQGTGKQVMLGKALGEQQKEIQRLQESGPTNMSLRGAQKYLDDAIAEYNAPSKYGPENGFVNWAGGLGSQLSNYDTWTAGVTEMARAIDLKNIVEKMNTGKSLPPAEQAKLDAFLLYNLVQESRQEDISSAYSIGKGTAESIPFMAEMFITAGIGAAGKKLILKSLLKKGNKEAAEKIARIFGYKIDDIAEDKAKKEVTDFALKEVKQGAIERSARQIGQDVAMTAAMPTTWTAISEDKVNKILNGEEYGFKDFLRTFAGQTIETGTEHWGGKIVDKALGSVMPLDKIWGKTRWGKIFTNDFIQSPLGETGEEYVGAAVNYIRSLNPMYSEKSNEELRAEAEHMFSPEGFTQTFLTVLPMSVLGGAGNVISHKKTINTYKKSKNNLISMLTELGATNEQAQTIFTSIEGSSGTQGFTEKLQYMVGALKTQYQEQHPNASLEEMEEYFNKLDKVVGDYYRSAYYLNELGGEIQSAIDKMDETEKQQVKQDFENEVKQQITNPSVTEDSDKNLEVLSTGNKPIEFKINVTEETRESGKTSDVTKEVKVSFRSNAYSYANDGSIISDKFSLLANGSPLSGKKKEEYFGLINDQLRAEKAKADEKTAQERANQAQLEQEREAQAQQIARQKIAAEQKKKQLRETTPMKEGVVDTESSKTTPAHIFLWNLDNHGQEEAIKRAARAVGESIYAKEKLEEDTKMSSTKRDAEIDRANMRIAAYEQAVKDFVGETAAQQLRQDAEGQVALLLQRDMENAKEEERVRLERIAEKQRIKEENRKLYRTNLENSGKNNNFAQNSNDNGNNEGTNRELQEGSGNGVLETAGNGQTQSGGNQQANGGVPSTDRLGDNQRDRERVQAGLLSTHPDDIIDVERGANDEVSELLQKYGLTYSKHRVFQVTGELFRQTILQEKSKNPQGWMVSVHPLESDEYEVGYNDCKCYLTADGLSGIAITPTGDIISLFSSVSGDHRMEKLIAWALTHGGKKEDCYANGLESLYARFGGKVVSQTPFVEKWAPEDWDGESRGQVVFLTFPTVEEALQTYADYKQKGIKLPEVDLSEDVVRNFPDEDNGYNEAGEYRDKVLSGEITQEKETPEEESTSQDQDTSKEVQQEPIDLTADNVVMMVQGASSTRTTYTFARHEVDEDGNDVYINLGCPFGSKSVNGNIGRKLSTKTWAVTDKSKKLFYVKDAYGTPFACYAITSEDISNKKFSRESSKLNAVVAKTGEPLYGVTSMQDAYIMQGDKEVSILKDKKQHGNKIKAESIESLLKHKVVIRFASEAKGEKEISVTLYDLLYGEFASDVNNFAKAREFTNVEAVNSGYGAGLYTGLLKDAIMDMAKAWNEYCSNNGLKNIKPDLSKLSQQDRDLFWFARQEMNRENREEADKASMEVQTSVPAKTMGDSNGIYNNPLHQLGVMLYIANKLGYVQGEVFNNLPGKVRQVSEGKHIITKEVIEKVRERYNALKSGNATVNLDKFETERQEMEYYEKFYHKVLNDEPVHNRLAITDDNSRKKALKNIHDSKLREEAAKEVAKEEKKETPKDKSEKEPAAKKKESSKEKVDNNTSILDEIVTTGFEQLDKALADGDQTKQEEIIQQLNVIIAGNAEYQDRLAKMLADAEAKKIRAEVLQKKIAEQEKAKSETEEIDENSYNAVDAISEEVPAPTKRRKKNRQPVQVEAEKVEKTLEAAPIQEAVAEPDVVSETKSTEEQPMTVEAVEETAVQDDANVTFDASSLEGKSEKELKDRQSDLYLKDELQGLTKEEELELAAIKERLGGAKVYKGYEGAKQSDRNKGMSNDLAFSVSPQQRAQTARSRVLGEMMMRVLGRIKGIKVHVLNTQEEVTNTLDVLRGTIDYSIREGEIEYLKTPKGTIYGFAIGDEIYITQEGLNANTPIHEYTHLWVKALRSNEPKAWKKIVGELKKNKALWESVTKYEAYKDLEGDDAIASEVFARYVGDKGEALLEELAKKQKFGNEKLEEAFINRVKRSLRGFWEKILNLLVKPFGLKYNFKPKNIDEFANLTLRDLFDGKELDVEDTRINEEIESIKQKAIDNGTFMKAPNGQPSNLPEKLWLLVRTKNFKNWFGDWENDPLHASKVVDENGEPMVVYHGTGSAGFETFRLHSESDANTGSRGFFTTENRRVASVYTRDSWTEMPSNAQDAILGADPHEAVYSLFMNMRNPMVVDFADENGNKRHWNEYPTNRWVVAGDEQLGMEDAEFSSEEEANEYLSQFGSSDKPIHVKLTTDDFLRKASEVGFDGCIFKNVYDGNFTMGEEMTDYVALSPNQLKSTNNKGYFSTIDDRIEYQYAEDELTQLDEHAEELIREQEEKGNSIQLDPDLSEQEREGWWESVVTRVMDQSNCMRLMLESINAYRKVKGLEPLDGDVYDVRTKFEACNSIIANKIGFLERGIQQELDDTIREFAKVVEDSQFYKNHKKEVGGENPTTLTPVEFIERYLIARNNWERAKEGKPRGIAEFKDRMGMGVIEFSNAFTEAYGEKVVLNLWDKIRQMTDFALDTNLEGGLISEEMHAELKAKKFYVPQRGFWDDVNGENDRENEEDILKRRTRGSRTAQNKLDSMHKAEGGKSLAEGCLAYIARDARQAIKLSEENKVKKVMFDLLRDNEDWCHEPEHGFKVPRQAFFYTDENGDIQMMDDGPTPEQVQEMRMLKNIVKQLREEYKRATTEQEREEIASEIEETESLYPYFDEKDSWRIMHSRVSSQYGKNGLRKNKDAKKAKAITGLYVNGVPCEIEMTPRFVRVADALNGRRDMTGEFSAIKSVTSWLSAQYTINNPTFFAVNITRDTPYIITKGATEYGPEFSLRFTANWAASQKAIWKYLITGEIDNTDIGAQLLDFLNNGGNTGYSNLEELQKFRNHVKDLNPGGLERLQRELSTVEGASNVGKVLLESVGKGTVKFGDKLLGWAELRPLAQVLNEWSEIISRFSAYKSVVDMGLGVNEGIKAAHNLSTNFNRRGLGAPFTNFFNSLSVFANAGIQGASGYFRTLDSQGSAYKELVKSYEKRVKELRDKYNNVTDESLKSYYDEQIRLTSDLLNSAKKYKSEKAKSIAKKVAKTAAYMGMMPAFLGFLSTMLSPDDDDKEYTPGQYERDNYIVIGDMRIALNEQLKPWWCIGVNIAQLLRERRTLKQATNSVVTSVITNWLPVAQNIKEPISMIVDNVTSQEEWNIAQIARTAIMPSAMQSLNQWADNKNFLGGKLRFDIRDTPEYEMAPNEAALYQDLARALYAFGGGNEKVSSKTKDDGTKLRKWWDVNPKEIKANLFWIPSGALDVFCLGYGIYKDTKEKIEGDYKGTNVRVKDLPIINRFYKPNDNTLYRYAIVREVRAMVKQHNDRISNLEKQAAHFEDIYNHTSDPSAKESYNEAKRLIKEAKKDAVLNKLRILIGRYDNISIRSFQNEIGESRKEVESYHGEAVDEMNSSEQELVQLMLQGRNIKKGLKHSKDVPEWIEWFDKHNPLRK